MTENDDRELGLSSDERIEALQQEIERLSENQRHQPGAIRRALRAPFMPALRLTRGLAADGRLALQRFFESAPPDSTREEPDRDTVLGKVEVWARKRPGKYILPSLTVCVLGIWAFIIFCV